MDQACGDLGPELELAGWQPPSAPVRGPESRAAVRGITPMINRRRLVFLACLAPLSSSMAGGLGGSPASMEQQHAVAVESDYSFLRKPADIDHLVKLGRLVEVSDGADLSLSDVSFPFARPEVRTFLASLAADYRDEFGARLVVTSLTRPATLQPLNAHDLSVHPAGMAADLRIPAEPAQRAWMEARLLSLEDAGAIDITREKHPPHYHVAVFAEKYLPIAVAEDTARLERRARAELARLAAAAAGGRPKPASTGMSMGLISLGSLLILVVGARFMAIRWRQQEPRLLQTGGAPGLT